MTLSEVLQPVSQPNYQYFKERLADTSLLEKAVVVGMPPYCDLAVPVGGQRRGGWAHCERRLQARVIQQLSNYPGLFPNPRPDGKSFVVWGDEPPEYLSVRTRRARGDRRPTYEWRLEYDRASGAFYGYSEEAVNAFISEWVFQ